MSFFWSLIAFFLILTPIILIHELGHFVAARLSGIRVQEFGLGFPPRALTLFERKGTLFTLNWIPLGGFVRPAGEDDASIPDGLAASSKRARFFTLVAGSLANFVLAAFIFWITFMMSTPVVDTERVAVGGVAPGTPAETFGLLAGDIFIEANGQPITSFEALTAEVTRSKGQDLALLVERAGKLVTVVIVPRADGDYDPATEGPLGITITNPLTGEMERLGPLEAAAASGRTIYEYTRLTLSVPAMLINGELSAREARPVSIIGISQMGGQVVESSASSGDFSGLLGFTAIISIALGLTNLLPIPALDGGRILFVLIEAVRGRRIEPEREGLVHVVGMLVLLGLMAVLMVQDIFNPIIF